MQNILNKDEDNLKVNIFLLLQLEDEVSDLKLQLCIHYGQIAENKEITKLKSYSNVVVIQFILIPKSPVIKFLITLLEQTSQLEPATFQELEGRSIRQSDQNIFLFDVKLQPCQTQKGMLQLSQFKINNVLENQIDIYFAYINQIGNSNLIQHLIRSYYDHKQYIKKLPSKESDINLQSTDSYGSIIKEILNNQQQYNTSAKYILATLALIQVKDLDFQWSPYIQNNFQLFYDEMRAIQNQNHQQFHNKNKQRVLQTYLNQSTDSMNGFLLINIEELKRSNLQILDLLNKFLCEQKEPFFFIITLGLIWNLMKIRKLSLTDHVLNSFSEITIKHLFSQSERLKKEFTIFFLNHQINGLMHSVACIIDFFNQLFVHFQHKDDVFIHLLEKNLCTVDKLKDLTTFFEFQFQNKKDIKQYFSDQLIKHIISLCKDNESNTKFKQRVFKFLGIISHSESLCIELVQPVLRNYIVKDPCVNTVLVIKNLYESRHIFNDSFYTTFQQSMNVFLKNKKYENFMCQIDQALKNLEYGEHFQEFLEKLTSITIKLIFELRDFKDCLRVECRFFDSLINLECKYFIKQMSIKLRELFVNLIDQQKKANKSYQQYFDDLRKCQRQVNAAKVKKIIFDMSSEATILKDTKMSNKDVKYILLKYPDDEIFRQVNEMQVFKLKECLQEIAREFEEKKFLFSEAQCVFKIISQYQPGYQILINILFQKKQHQKFLEKFKKIELQIIGLFYIRQVGLNWCEKSFSDILDEYEQQTISDLNDKLKALKQEELIVKFAHLTKSKILSNYLLSLINRIPHESDPISKLKCLADKTQAGLQQFFSKNLSELIVQDITSVISNSYLEDNDVNNFLQIVDQILKKDYSKNEKYKSIFATFQKWLNEKQYNDKFTDKFIRFILYLQCLKPQNKNVLSLALDKMNRYKQIVEKTTIFNLDFIMRDLEKIKADIRSTVEKQSGFTLQSRCKSDTHNLPYFDRLLELVYNFPVEKNVMFEELEKITTKELQQMCEYLNDHDGAELSSQCIIYAINVKDLLNGLESIMFLAEPSTHLQTLVASLSEFLHLDRSQFSILTKDVQRIKEFKLQLSQKEPPKKTQILNIMTKSFVQFFSQEADLAENWLAEVLVEKTKISVKVLNELRDCAFLIKRDPCIFIKQEDSLELIQQFIELTSTINICLSSLNSLFLLGYYNEDEKFSQSFEIKLGQFKELRSFQEKLLIQEKNWSQFIKVQYSKSYRLSFCQSSNFPYLELYLNGESQSEEKEKLSQSLIKFMGFATEKIPVQTQKQFERVDPETRLIQMIDKLNHLESIQVKQPKSEVYDKDVQYIVSTNVIQSVFTIYQSMYRIYPRIDQLLYCNRGISSNQVFMFIERCCNNNMRDQYCFIYADLLELKVQDELIRILNQKDENVFGMFNFIFLDSTSRIFQYVKRMGNVKLITENNYLPGKAIKDIIQHQKLDVKIFSSKRPGLGKSFQIMKLAQNKNKRLINFPLFGRFSQSEIGRRLMSLDFNIPSILALVLSPVSNVRKLNQIVTNICLFRVFITNKYTIVLPDNFDIVIEIQNSSDDEFSNNIEFVKFSPENFNIFIPDFHINMIEINSKISEKYQQVEKFYHEHKEELKCEHEEFLQYMKYQLTTIIQDKLKQKLTYYRFETFIQTFYTLISNFQMSLLNLQKEEIMAMNQGGYQDKKLADLYNNVLAQIWSAFLITYEEINSKSIQRENQSEYNIIRPWESGNHFFIIFVKDGSLLFLYKDPQSLPQFFKQFIQYTTAKTVKELSPSYQLEDYRNFTSDQFEAKLNVLKTRVGEIQDKKYKLTTDNFLKICVIYQKVVSNVPVVIMGETGCGKTYLINFLCSSLLNEQIRVINIHAGIKSQTIIDKLKAFIKEYQPQTGKIWIFFDEFNTTPDVQLICEIMTQRTMLGDPLPDWMVFIAACNPYVKKQQTDLNSDHERKIVGLPRYKSQTSTRYYEMFKQKYFVEPLPEAIEEFVWDFGQLQQADYKDYIYSMLPDSPDRERLTKLLVTCQMFFHQNDQASVSLRDVNRFVKLQQWFYESLQKRKSLKTQNSHKNIQDNRLKIDFEKLNNQELIERANVLAVMLCYYMRIICSKVRKRFRFEVAMQLGIQAETLELWVKQESNDYISRMVLDQDIAINEALCENIFGIIPCLLNKIPVLILGKPGCSKSLAVQLVYSNLLGRQSNDPYFQTLPLVNLFSFQGSNTCTSQGISKIFAKAKKFQQESQSGYLATFLFDEIGLAELSEHNPLKILHNLLEDDRSGSQNQSIGFIGISNSTLDSAKMNRILLISRPDPNSEELSATAQGLSQCDSNVQLEVNKKIILFYETIVHDLYQNFTEISYRYFFSLRDFYRLIKYVHKQNSQNFEQQNYDQILLNGILRNFSGSEKTKDYVDRWIDEFCYSRPKREIDLILENLEEQNSRYLMLIGREDIAFSLIENHFIKRRQPYQIIIGSRLANDESQDEYNLRLLKKIKLCAEEGISLILNNINYIESSLYNLFNQNFASVGNKQFCRIAFGEYLNPQCEVHVNFRCILVISSEANIVEKDPPLLNRFEKHIVKYDFLLAEREKAIQQDCINWVSKFRLKALDLSNIIFPSYSKELLTLIILNEFEKITGEHRNEETFLRVRDRLIEQATPDILIALEVCETFDQEEKSEIIQRYFEIHQADTLTLLKRQQETNQTEQYQQQNLLIMTYSSYEQIEQYFKGQTAIVQQNCEYFKCESEIFNELFKFYENPDQTIFILEIDFNQSFQHINYLQNLILNFQRNEAQGVGIEKFNQKLCVLLVLLQRCGKRQALMPFSIGWKYQVCYDISISQIQENYKYVHYSNEELIFKNQDYSFICMASEMVQDCIQIFHFHEIDFASINQLADQIKHYLKNDKEYSDTLEQKLQQLFQLSQNNQSEDWKYQIFEQLDAPHLKDAIRQVCQRNLSDSMTSLLYFLLSISTIQTYQGSTDGSPTTSYLNNLWINQLKKSVINTEIQLQQKKHSIQVETDFALTFPFIKLDYCKFRDISDRTREALSQGKEFAEYDEDEKDQDERTIILFIQQFSELSILKTNSEQLFLTEIELQNLYMKNLIKIYLRENILPSIFEEWLLPIFNPIKGIKDKGFFSQLYSFIELEVAISQFCQILLLWEEVNKKYFSGIKNTLELINNLLVDDTNKPLIVMQKIVQEILKFILQSFQQALKNISKVAISFYDRLYYFLRIFDSQLPDDKKVRGLNMIKFLVELIQLIVELDLGNNAEILGTIISILNANEQEKRYDLITCKSIFNLIHNICGSIGSENESNKKDRISKCIFLSKYYEILIDESQQMISDIFQTPNLVFYTMKISNNFLNQLFEQITIEDIPSIFKEESQQLIFYDYDNEKIELLETLISSDIEHRQVQLQVILSFQQYLEKYWSLDLYQKLGESASQSEGIFDSILEKAIIKLQNKQPKFPFLHKIFTFTFLRLLLQFYYRNRNNKKLKGDQYIEDKLCTELPELHQLKFYACKLFYQGRDKKECRSGFKKTCFQKWCRLQSHPQWIKKLIESQTKKRIQINLINYSYFPGLIYWKRTFFKFIYLIYGVEEEISKPRKNKLKNLIKKMSLDKQKVNALGMILLYLFYTPYSAKNPPEVMDKLKTVYCSISKHIKKFISADFERLTRQFALNFPNISFLQAKQQVTTEQLERNILIFQILITLAADSKGQKLTAHLFFNPDGSLGLNHFLSSYIPPLIPAELKKISQYEKQIINLKQYQGEKNSISCFECRKRLANGEQCGYIIMILNNNNENNQDQKINKSCDWCKQLHTFDWNHRESDQDPSCRVIKTHDLEGYLRERVEGIKKQIPRGYVFQKETTVLRKSPSHILHRCIINIFIYYFVISDIPSEVNKKELRNQINQSRLVLDETEKLQEFLQDQIKADLDNISSQLSNNNLNLIPLLRYIENLPGFFEQYWLADLQNVDCAVRFYESIDQHNILDYSDNENKIASKYSQTEQKVKAIFERLQFFNYLHELNIEREEINQEAYALTRITASPTWKDLVSFKKCYNEKSGNGNWFGLLQIYLDNLGKVQYLKIFYPLMQFIGALLEGFNFKITREDANKLSQESIFSTNEDLKQLYKTYCEELENLFQDPDQVRPDKTAEELRKKLKQLRDAEFLSEFLPDRKEGAPKLVVQIVSELAQIQNTVLELLQNEYLSARSRDNFFDQKPINPLRLKPSHIIASQVELENYHFCDLRYGFGKRSIYELSRLELMFMQNLIDNKFVDASQLNSIQYQFELDFQISVVTQVRKVIPQEELSNQNQKACLEAFFNSSSALPLQERQRLNSWVLDELGRLMYQIAHSAEEGTLKIYEFASREIRNYPKLGDKNCELGKVLELKHLVVLYEAFEEKLFPVFQEKVRKDHKIDFHNRQAVVEQIKQWLNKQGEFEVRVSCLKQAYKRFISRDLSAKLNVKDHQSKHISIDNEGIWDYKLLTEKREWFRALLENFPKSLLIENTIPTFEILEEIHGLIQKELKQKQQEREKSPTKPSSSQPRGGSKSGKKVKF